MLGVSSRDGSQTIADPTSMQRDRRCERIVAPIVERRRRRHECEVIAAEGPCVVARLPLIEIRLNEREGHRHADPADRFRNADDVRTDPGPLEAEEMAGAPASNLNVVNDQRNALCSREL